MIGKVLDLINTKQQNFDQKYQYNIIIMLFLSLSILKSLTVKFYSEARKYKHYIF